jgi:hypothetical protein
MSIESSDAFKIHRAPNGKFYVCGDGAAICLPNGNLRYFETEREAWAFLTDCDKPESTRLPHSGVQPRSSGNGDEAASVVAP